MTYLISVIHACTCVLVVIFILLQNPKGGGVLGALGGAVGSKALFTPSGAGSFLVTMTKWLAIVFAATSLLLSYISSKKEDSLMKPTLPISQPVDSKK